MEVCDRRLDDGAATFPQLYNSLSGYRAGSSPCNPVLLQQPLSLFAGEQPLTITGDIAEEEREEDATYSFKKKLYEIEPSGDPQLEERRQRALYAKRNRDMKKKMQMKLQQEVSTLSTAKEQYRTDLTRLYDLTQTQQHKIEELEQCLLDSHQQLREKEEHIRRNRERMSHLKGHLDLIAEGLEENNLSRRMLLNLLSQIH
ncbi:hypothetical protein O3P69_003761 [Scylla paramamosain]|uniref:BZIP domain-containing protein n=1 Tax=Scylla paramamosain TaxID=85552 RepID=A0AAW0UDD6_SCYPA